MCLILAIVINGHAAAQTSTGQEYILCFLGEGLTSSEFAKFPDSGSCIYLASYNDTTHIMITCKAYPAYKKIFTLPPNSHLRYKIWRDITPQIETSEEVNNSAILLTSDFPVTCIYNSMTGESISDATIVYPKNRYTGAEYVAQYMVMSYPVDKDTSDSTGYLTDWTTAPSEFAIGAFEDSTTVTIIPSCTTKNGTNSGAIVHYLLNRGQCVQVYSSLVNPVHFYLNFDLTGSTIQSNKPISVYCGNGATTIPSDFASGQATYDDGTLLEAVPPTSSWGKLFLCRWHAPRTEYACPGYLDSAHDMLRILSESKNTSITINGIHWVTLDGGQYRDTQIIGTYVIETSQPALVAQYDRSQYCRYSDSVGGPDMAIVPPLEQRNNDFRFFSMHDFEDFTHNGLFKFNVHYIVIAGDESIKNTITLDGIPLPDTGFVDIPTQINGEKLVIGSYQIDSGFHHISTTNPPEKGMTLLVYGGGRGFGYAYGLGNLSAPQSRVVTSSFREGGLKITSNLITTSTDFQFDALKESAVLEIFDLLGRSLLRRQLPAGQANLHLDMQQYPPGIYFARIGGETVRFVKM